MAKTVIPYDKEFYFMISLPYLVYLNRLIWITCPREKSSYLFCDTFRLMGAEGAWNAFLHTMTYTFTSVTETIVINDGAVIKESRVTNTLATINIFKCLYKCRFGDINVWMLDQTFLHQETNIWICLGNVYGCKGRYLPTRCEK